VEGFREEALKAIASVKWIPLKAKTGLPMEPLGVPLVYLPRQHSWGVDSDFLLKKWRTAAYRRNYCPRSGDCGEKVLILGEERPVELLPEQPMVGLRRNRHDGCLV